MARNINVSMEELVKFANYISNFAKSISYECTELKQASNKLYGSLDSETLGVFEVYVKRVSQVIEENYETLNALESRVKDYLGFISQLKCALLDNSSTSDGIPTEKGANSTIHKNTYFVKSSPEDLHSEVLSSFQTDIWNLMSLETKKECISSLARCVTSDLQLKNPPKVNYYYREPLDGALSRGFYRANDNTININLYAMKDSLKTAITVAHELRHAWQWERAANPITDEDRAFAHNLKNYIRYEINPLGYWNQPVERDARQYASKTTELLDRRS